MTGMHFSLVTRRGFLCLLIAALALNAGSLRAQSKPKYIFLMIGDGMGFPAVSVATEYKKASGAEDAKLVMSSFPVKGEATTHPIQQDKITDSAASGTALACGVKTKNGMIAMTPDEKPRKSVAHYARESGRKVAIISSVGINHATPACFYAHQKSRSLYDDIGAEVAQSGFDFLAGEPLLGKKPERNREAIRAAGYRLISDREGVLAFNGEGRALIEHAVPYRADLKEDSVRLVDLVRAGLKSVGNAAGGCFMMVEGGKIDWAGHANDFGSIAGETLEFDEAIGAVYEFYSQHPDQTLIVVTSDHETGDFKFNPDAVKERARIAAAVDAQMHSAPVLDDKIKEWRAQKIGAAELAARSLQACGVADATPEELAGITAIADTLLHAAGEDERSRELKKMYGSRNPLVIACQSVAAARCGASFSSFGHTSAKVPVFAIGPGSELFAGESDNALIGSRLIELVQPSR
jgi:alkaline phosphatase